MCIINVSHVTVFIAVSGAAEVGWAILPDQTWFLYDFAKDLLVKLPDGALLVRCNADGEEVKKGSRSELRLIFDADYADGVMSLEFAGLCWGEHLVSGKDLLEVLPLSFCEELIQSASSKGDVFIGRKVTNASLVH